jgi:tetratricopeptide (TPR) repeat protein
MNPRRAPLLVLALVAVVLAAWLGLRHRREAEPPAATADNAAATAREPEAPADTIGPFFVGLSSLDVEANERAGRVFDELARKLPDEPAVWANLGIARLRLGDGAGAEEALSTAEKLAPRNDEVILLRATLDEDQGQFARAIERLQTLPNPDAAALYRLTQLLARTGNDADLAAQRDIFDRLQKLRPDNPVVAFGRARLLARMEDKSRLQEALTALDAHREQWSASEVRQIEAARNAVASGNFRAAGTALTFLQNLRQASPEYQTAMAELGLGGGSIGRPIRDFLAYRRPEVVVSPPDDALAFTVAPDAALPAPAGFYLALDLGAKNGASVVAATGDSLRLGGADTLALPATRGPFGRHAVCAADFNNDFLPDLAAAGATGLRIWTQGTDGHFSLFPPADDVRAFFAQPSRAVWALDYDADGDLDLLVAREGAAPGLLRNNGDGGFAALDTFAAFPEMREACWADFDGDGDNDLAFLDSAGRVLIAWNDRAGAFAAPAAVSDAPAVALACGDLDGAGEMALLVLGRSGAIGRARFNRGQRAWQIRDVARWTAAADLAAAFAGQRASLTVADFDNNGAPDVVASAGATSALWLNAGRGEFQALGDAPALFVASVADLDGDGLLDLVGSNEPGGAVARGRGTKNYHWQSIQTRTLGARADSRINSFGLGGRIEVRAGPLLAMAPIVSSRTHFGLGEQSEIGLARIVWPNGVAQVEFELQPDQEVTATQRLKGSCPWVFTRQNGRFRFVKDFIWRSPLGMRINSQDTAGVDQTEDWILLPGRVLTADDGAYEVRVTAELWETHFFDRVALQVVDHPAGTAALVDERFVPVQPPKLAVIAASPAKPLAAAQDQAGRDVSRALASADGECVNDFPLGRFQGVAEDHWIEFELPDDTPAERALVLVGEGWIYPTDSSLNVAISQGRRPPPRGLVLEAPDAQGGWRAVSGDLGFPAGKNKTVVIPLPGDVLQRGERRFRLRTNLEVYWDRLGWAVAEDAAPLKRQTVETQVAELRHRGFSQLGAPARRRPDVPASYETLSGTGPRWRDLEGYYTRYGDVRELLQGTDDRYVIMNAGDEIVLRFAAPPPPPAGWTRDFVLIGDGWVKDGDFNTANSRTVGPLPSHAQRHYGGPERPALADDPVFRQHREDWERFHTRYVTPWAFDRGLMAGTDEAAEGVLQ